MLIKFFTNGVGGGAGPVDYLIAEQVLAYDDNRNLMRDAEGQPELVTRDPLPEVMRGSPEQMMALIDACPFKWSYRAGVIAFAAEDAPTEQQQREAMDSFEALAFAGLEPDEYAMLWVRHTHEQRVELHFTTPRVRLSTQQSLNIAPPGYQKAFDSLRDKLNLAHDWADPMAPERRRDVQITTETPARARSRDEVQAFIAHQIEHGVITNRPEMIECLQGVGFEVPRAGKDYLTVKDPDNDQRWRLKGAIYHDDWQRPHPEHRIAEPAPEYADASEPSRNHRLADIGADELERRYQNYIQRRAAYNHSRGRQLDQGRAPEPERDPPEPALGGMDHALHPVRPAHSDVPRGVPAELLEPQLGRADGHQPDAGAWPHAADDQRRDDHHDRPRAREDHPLRQAHSMPQNQTREGMNNGAITHPLSYTAHTDGARIARLRRAIGERLEPFRTSVERARDAIERAPRSPVEHFERLRERIAGTAAHIRKLLERPRQRIIDLGDTHRTLGRQLEATESRRATLEERERELTSDPQPSLSQ